MSQDLSKIKDTRGHKTDVLGDVAFQSPRLQREKG